jgi:hypothetical protein
MISVIILGMVSIRLTLPVFQEKTHEKVLELVAWAVVPGRPSRLGGAVVNFKQMAWAEFSEKYCTRQECTPEQLAQKLRDRQKKWNPEGFMLLECQVMDSSYLGELTCVGYGGDATFRKPPEQPVSCRGLASDTAVVVGLLALAEIPPE